MSHNTATIVLIFVTVFCLAGNVASFVHQRSLGKSGALNAGLATALACTFSLLVAVLCTR